MVSGKEKPEQSDLPCSYHFVSMYLLVLRVLSIHSYYTHIGQGLPLVFECIISFNDHSRLRDLI